MNPTPPSHTSAAAFYLSNWQDLTGIWKASKLTQLDTTHAGPRLAELHYLRGSFGRRTVNQIVDYAGFFRDESAQVKYTNIEQFDSEAWFESGPTDAGTLTTNYLGHAGAAAGMRVSRSYAGPPRQPFFVVRYTLDNPTNADIAFNVLDQVHLRNLDLGKDVHAWHDAAHDALIADMTASGQLFMVLGALQPVDGHQVGNNADTSPASPTVGGWYSFDAAGTVMNNDDLRAGDVDLAFQKRVTVAAHATERLYFYIGICETEADLNAAIGVARSLSGEAWFSTTAAAYSSWLSSGNQGRRVHFDDDGINVTFDRALIMIKNTQNPVLGTFAATTNPFAYGYKNWVRDAGVTAIALDASGHHAEAEHYWRWMADRQGNDGTWKTTYDMWDGSYAPFVEPEYDSIGVFLYGVYRHYASTADSRFLGDLWPAVKRSADWILTNIRPNGFGAADFSIWEEDRALEHNSYTQAWYVAGLYATQRLAEVLGDTALAGWYGGGAGSILTVLQRPSTWFPPGSWNPLGYFNRAVNSDNSVQPLIDSSSNVLITLGIVDHESERATHHIATVVGALTRQTFGVARYEGDTFYFTNVWSPGGNEALGLDPSWPQMSLWVAVYDVLVGRRDDALSRLQWYVSVTGKGYMPPGEAISNVTLQPLPSSMSEPLTAAAFLLTALTYEGQYSLSIVPPVYNAGTAKSLRIGIGVADGGTQWNDVPYFIGSRPTADAAAMCSVKRVYCANDSGNIYLRVHNWSQQLSAFQQQPLFVFQVYSQDFGNEAAESSNVGAFGELLARPMSFMVERLSNSDAYHRWRVTGDTWVDDGPVNGVIAPQWNTTTGELEAVVPVAALSSRPPAFGNGWAHLLVVLAALDQATGARRAGGTLLLHYRLSTPDQNWIYGNIDK